MTLTSRLSRLLALLLLVLALGGLYRLVVLPVWSSFSNQAQSIAAKQAQLAGFQRIASRAVSVKALAEKLEVNPDIEKMLLRGDSVTLAAASLQEQLKGVIERHGGRLASTQVLPADGSSSFAKIGLNVRMRADASVAQRVFYELEASQPMLFVDEVMILARRSRVRNRSRLANQRRNVAARKANTELDLRFNLTGFMAGADASDGAGS